jgi:raffinose/stachyose/melibiose transport system permease protein
MSTSRRYPIIWEVILWIMSLSILYPLAMVVMTSFKSLGEASQLSISLPDHFHFENYKTVFVQGKMLRALMNSMLITGCAVLLIVILSGTLSFTIMRNRSTLNRAIYSMMTLGLIAPFAALPTIKTLQFLHIYGTYISVILVYTALFMSFATMLFSGFILTVPKELDEAGIIDGCIGFSLFYKVILPLLLPITVTVAILNFMWVWNEFYYPLFLVNKSSMWTLPLTVYNFYGQFNRSWHLVSANMIIVSMPVVIAYLFAQKYIVSGMTAGAVKG